MPDINFLDDNQDDKDGPKENKPKSGAEVAWTEPDDSPTDKKTDAPDYKSYNVRGNKAFGTKSGAAEKQAAAAGGKKDDSEAEKPRKKSGFFGWFGKPKTDGTKNRAGAGTKNEKLPQKPAENGMDSGHDRDAPDKKAEKSPGGGDNTGMSAPKMAAPADGGGQGFAGRKLNLNYGQWAGPAVLKTNLVGGEDASGFEWKKNISVLAINIMSAFLIIAVVYAGLIVWKKYASNQSEFLIEESGTITQKIITLEKELDASKVDNFNDKLKLARSLLDKHIYWSNFFGLLERDTLRNVYYSGKFSGDMSGEYNLGAVTDNFQTIADQIKVMRLDEDVVDVGVAGGESAGKATGGSGGVSFRIDLKVNPGLFLNKD